jgi:hypothetical protein
MRTGMLPNAVVDFLVPIVVRLIRYFFMFLVGILIILNALRSWLVNVDLPSKCPRDTARSRRYWCVHKSSSKSADNVSGELDSKASL